MQWAKYYNDDDIRTVKRHDKPKILKIIQNRRLLIICTSRICTRDASQQSEYTALQTKVLSSIRLMEGDKLPHYISDAHFSASERYDARK